MHMTVGIERATKGDWPSIVQLLQDSGLSIDGLLEHLDTAFVAHDGTNIVGCAALEVYADGALLRSVAVSPHARGRGIGHQLTDAAVILAQSLGLSAVYLLTTTAPRYFPRLAFHAITRAEVPASVQQSIEFRSACCASAVVMRRVIRVE